MGRGAKSLASKCRCQALFFIPSSYFPKDFKELRTKQYSEFRYASCVLITRTQKMVLDTLY
jgi:hypothetical protein